MSVKYLDMIRLVVLSILCAMPVFTAYGQDTATGEFTVTNIQGSGIGSNVFIVIGEDNEIEIKTSGNIRAWFENGISVESASQEFVADSDGAVSRQFVVDIKSFIRYS